MMNRLQILLSNSTCTTTPGDFDAAAHAGAAEEVDAIAAEALREAAAQLGRARGKAVGVGGDGAGEAGEAGVAGGGGGSSREEL